MKLRYFAKLWGSLPKIPSGARAPVEPLVNGAPEYTFLLLAVLITPVSVMS